MKAISGRDIKADDKPRNTRNTRNKGEMKSQRDFIIQPGVAPGPSGLRRVTSHKSIHNSERVVSIPNIPLIEFNLIFPQKFPELILKRNLPMMFLLASDVMLHRLDL